MFHPLPLSGNHSLAEVNADQQTTRLDRNSDNYIASPLPRRHTLPISSVPPTPLGSRSPTPNEQRDGEHDNPFIEELSSVVLPKIVLDSDVSESISDSQSEPPQEDTVLAELDSLVGLEAVKDYFKELGLYIHHNKVLNVDFTQERFHAIFQGNPGTGKTTVARLYAKFLRSKRVLKSSRVIETSGGVLASKGPNGAIKIFDEEEEEEEEKGGVLFVDEAYQLVADHSSYSGKQVLDIILAEMENHAERWVVIFAGYKKDFEPFLAHNEGLSSRIPRMLDFDDFNTQQLYDIMLSLFQKRFKYQKCRYKIEGQPGGVFIRAAIHRISQGRGRHGFGNARTVQNYFQRICQRQARRVGQIKNPSMEERLYFTKEDILGPRPTDVRAKSKAWAKLQSLIGLSEVKQSVQIMFQLIETNYQRELKGMRPHAHSLNRVFVGSPGTGKTTVAKLYGRILADLEFLSKGDVVVKTPADFIGDAVGKSESNTAAILASTIGKVLIIDEAYMLDPGDSTSNPGDDRCVILIGYEDKMESLFQNGNPGLSGRFMADMPFRFTDYNNDELLEILKRDLKDRHIKYKPDAVNAAIDMLSRYRITQNFSNARAVKTLVSEAVLRNQERQMKNNSDSPEFDACLEAQDFDPWLSEWAISSGMPINYRANLSSQVSDSIIEQLENFLPGSQVLAHAKRDKPRNTPRTFVFVGPPGTGKMELALYMGRVFRDLGLLPTDQVVTCSAVSFIGQHVGHTTPITLARLGRGIGKVLVIQNLHQLPRGGFSADALQALTSFLDNNARRMAVILTGPKVPLIDLLRDHPDLGRHFRDHIIFNNLPPSDCVTLLHQLIDEVEPSRTGPLFALDSVRAQFQKAMWILSWCDRWVNSISVRYLAERMVRIADENRMQRAYQEPGLVHEWILTDTMAMEAFKVMFNDMRSAGGQFVEPVAEDAGINTGGTVASDPSAEATKPEAAPLEAESESAAIAERKEYAKATVSPQQKPTVSHAAIGVETAPQGTVQMKESQETKAAARENAHTNAREREEELQHLDTIEREAEAEKVQIATPCSKCGKVDCPQKN
ncbi:P-loop containing nucleoside triphosphate hydrolase protein [Xylaria arbuscula]|nr:P-loop containing nucleoside triphosphate hydrolase protein [Xylaria arbuscula]